MNGVQPMFSLESEQCVIGALLLDNNAIDFIGDLKAEHFFIEDNRLLFRSILRMITAKQGCDVVTLAEDLFDRDDGENWLATLGDMVANTPSAKNIGHYARIVINRATERALLAAAGEISAIAGGGLPTEEKVDKAQALVMGLAEQSAGTGGQHVASAVQNAVQMVIDGQAGNLKRTLCGYTDIDKRCDLLTPGDFIIVAGRPAMGKTSFVMNIAENVCQGDNKAVVVFSQEMGGTQLGSRMLASVGRVPLDRLIRNYSDLSAEDYDRMSCAVAKVADFNMHIDDRPARSLHQVRTYCRSIRRKHGPLGLVVIDYLQLMAGESGEGRHEDVASISRGLKVLAKELDTPVIALSQLNRGLENRPNKRPIMSDLRESGQLEQDADVICFIYRDEVYNPDTPDKGVAEIIFGKLRMGQVGTVALAFNGEFARFDNLCREWSKPETKEAPKQRRGFA